MASTRSGPRADCTADKIIAIWGGLIVCTSALLAARVLHLDERLPFFLVDEMVFGRRAASVEWFLGLELIVAAGTIATLQRRPRLAARSEFFGSAFFLAEALGDVGTYSDHPRLMAEELAFVGIYSYLLMLMIVYDRLSIPGLPSHVAGAALEKAAVQ